jgi:hypothetical protein
LYKEGGAWSKIKKRGETYLEFLTHQSVKVIYNLAIKNSLAETHAGFFIFGGFS